MTDNAIEFKQLTQFHLAIKRKEKKTMRDASRAAKAAMRAIEYGAKRLARGGAGGVFSDKSKGFLSRSLHTYHIPGSLNPELIGGVAYARIQNYGGTVVRSAHTRTVRSTGTTYNVRSHTATYRGKFYAQLAYHAQRPKIDTILRRAFDVVRLAK